MSRTHVIRSVVRWVIGCAAACGFVAIAALPAPVLAHADLLSTNPPDNAVEADPVVLVELTFSEGVEPSGRGFRLLDTDGVAVPSSAFQPDRTEVIIEPDEPLENGRFVVIWEAQSADSHVLNGSFSFTVEGAGSDATDGEGDEGGAVGDAPETSTTAATVTTSTLPVSVEADPAPEAAVLQAVAETADQSSALADIMAGLGRWATMAGALMAIGAFAFAATTLIGTPEEVRRSVRWIRRGSIIVIVGTLLEVAAVSIATSATSAGVFSPTHIMDAISIQFGIAVILRLVGAIALLQDPRALVVSRGRPIINLRRPRKTEVGPDVSGREAAGTTIVEAAQPYRIEVQHEWVMIVGLAAVAASFAFDGHSVDTGTIGRIASIIHVVAAGIWFGGLVVLGDTLVRRWKAGVDSDAAFMAIRFSRLAAVSLGLAAIAGVVLTWTIVDAPSEIVTSRWGRLLLVKVALVVVVTAIGAYNHFRVVPGVTDTATDEKAAILRRTTRIETAILVVVLAVTALLVAAVV